MQLVAFMLPIKYYQIKQQKNYSPFFIGKMQ
jgi:hypothetical protein